MVRTSAIRSSTFFSFHSQVNFGNCKEILIQTRLSLLWSTNMKLKPWGFTFLQHKSYVMSNIIWKVKLQVCFLCHAVEGEYFVSWLIFFNFKFWSWYMSGLFAFWSRSFCKKFCFWQQPWSWCTLPVHRSVTHIRGRERLNINCRGTILNFPAWVTELVYDPDWWSGDKISNSE